MKEELDAPDRTLTLYLELLKNVLLNTIYAEAEPGIQNNEREEGACWPVFAHTMIGRQRLDQLESAILDVVKNRVPGDFIETGVWRGGAAIFMSGVLKALREDRIVWAADSFCGLPKPDVDRYPMDMGDEHFKNTYLAVSLEAVKKNFAKYGLLDESVRFLEGWFKNTLPSAPIYQLAILRLDGDMYESTIQALESLYPKLSPGGYLIVDDYRLPGAHSAVHDYRNREKISEPIISIDPHSAYWIRAGDGPLSA